MVRPLFEVRDFAYGTMQLQFFVERATPPMLPVKWIHHRDFSPGSLAPGTCSFDGRPLRPARGIGTCRVKL
jgi:hypothetical protein